VGTVDVSGFPWASILVGVPGFIASPDDRTLRVSAKPLFGDPLAENLADGIDIGLLGIDLPTRRRNRMNGIVKMTHSEGFEVQVRQSFGNCPQYIQARTCQLDKYDPVTSKSIQKIETLGEVEKTIIASADTFFIATAYQSKTAGVNSGVDVSHRGGKPGFIRIDENNVLTVPDFSGNCHFNTFGNLELNPKAGLLFIDFGTGDLLYLTGTANVVWEGSEIEAYKGAERLLRFHLNYGYYVQDSVPLRWSLPALSPSLVSTGTW
jgi:predicted pyridoxine 5'-phosphate oxidase superfamily flavin-nucleotide-binding protein